MRDRINEKLLHSQTGHKIATMLGHYSNHKINGDDEQIQAAQIDVFGAIIEKAHMDNAGMYEHPRQDR